MKLTEKFKSLEEPQEKEFTSIFYEELYKRSAVYSDYIGYPVDIREDNYYKGFEDKPEWKLYLPKIQADILIAELKIIDIKFAELEKYFLLPKTSSSLRIVIDNIKAMAEKIYFQLKEMNERKINLENYLIFIREEEFKCEPGALSNLQKIFKLLTSTAETIIYFAKPQYVLQIAGTFMNRGNFYYIGDEVHRGNSLIDYVSAEYHIKPSEDIYINNRLNFQRSFSSFLERNSQSKYGVFATVIIISNDILFNFPSIEELSKADLNQKVKMMETIEEWIKMLNPLYHVCMLIDSETMEYRKDYQEIMQVMVMQSLQYYGYVFATTITHNEDFIIQYPGGWYIYVSKEQDYKELIKFDRLGLVTIGPEKKHVFKYIEENLVDADLEKFLYEIKIKQGLKLISIDVNNFELSILRLSNQSKFLYRKGVNFNQIKDAHWFEFLVLFYLGKAIKLYKYDEEIVLYLLERRPQIKKDYVDYLLRCEMTKLSSLSNAIKYIEIIPELVDAFKEKFFAIEDTKIEINVLFFLAESKKLLYILLQLDENELQRVFSVLDDAILEESDQANKIILALKTADPSYESILSIILKIPSMDKTLFLLEIFSELVTQERVLGKVKESLVGYIKNNNYQKVERIISIVKKDSFVLEEIKKVFNHIIEEVINDENFILVIDFIIKKEEIKDVLESSSTLELVSRNRKKILVLLDKALDAENKESLESILFLLKNDSEVEEYLRRLFIDLKTMEKKAMLLEVMQKYSNFHLAALDVFIVLKISDIYKIMPYLRNSKAYIAKYIINIMAGFFSPNSVIKEKEFYRLVFEAEKLFKTSFSDLIKETYISQNALYESVDIQNTLRIAEHFGILEMLLNLTNLEKYRYLEDMLSKGDLPLLNKIVDTKLPSIIKQFAYEVNRAKTAEEVYIALHLLAKDKVVYQKFLVSFKAIPLYENAGEGIISLFRLNVELENFNSFNKLIYSGLIDNFFDNALLLNIISSLRKRDFLSKIINCIKTLPKVKQLMQNLLYYSTINAENGNLRVFLNFILPLNKHYKKTILKGVQWCILNKRYDSLSNILTLIEKIKTSLSSYGSNLIEMITREISLPREKESISLMLISARVVDINGITERYIPQDLAIGYSLVSRGVKDGGFCNQELNNIVYKINYEDFSQNNIEYPSAIITTCFLIKKMAEEVTFLRYIAERFRILIPESIMQNEFWQIINRSDVRLLGHFISDLISAEIFFKLYGLNSFNFIIMNNVLLGLRMHITKNLMYIDVDSSNTKFLYEISKSLLKLACLDVVPFLLKVDESLIVNVGLGHLVVIGTSSLIFNGVSYYSSLLENQKKEYKSEKIISLMVGAVIYPTALYLTMIYSGPIAIYNIQAGITFLKVGFMVEKSVNLALNYFISDETYQYLDNVMHLNLVNEADYIGITNPID